jgi:hypothetical protein
MVCGSSDTQKDRLRAAEGAHFEMFERAHLAGSPFSQTHPIFPERFRFHLKGHSGPWCGSFECLGGGVSFQRHYRGTQGKNRVREGRAKKNESRAGARAWHLWPGPLLASGASACHRCRCLPAAGFAPLGNGARSFFPALLAGKLRTESCARGRAHSPLHPGAPWHGQSWASASRAKLLASDVSSGGGAERCAARRDAAADAAACEAGATSGRVQEGRQRGRQAAREARASLQGEQDHAVCVSSAFQQTAAVVQCAVFFPYQVRVV